MPSTLDAVRTLLEQVKLAFGQHGELENPEHPLHDPVGEVEAILREMEELQAERPTTEPPLEVRNPQALTVIYEAAPGVTDAAVKLHFSEQGLEATVLDHAGDKAGHKKWSWDRMATLIADSVYRE